MKKETHPTYYPKAQVECSCGQKFNVGSTKDNISVEICSSCHPFFSGNEKVMDIAGRIERFKTKRAAAKKSAK